MHNQFMSVYTKHKSTNFIKSVHSNMHIIIDHNKLTTDIQPQQCADLTLTGGRIQSIKPLQLAT